MRTTKPTVIIDLPREHVGDLDDRAQIAMILAPAYVCESGSPWLRST